jgi:hypothetical protein
MQQYSYWPLYSSTMVPSSSSDLTSWCFQHCQPLLHPQCHHPSALPSQLLCLLATQLLCLCHACHAIYCYTLCVPHCSETSNAIYIQGKGRNYGPCTCPQQLQQQSSSSPYIRHCLACCEHPTSGLQCKIKPQLLLLLLQHAAKPCYGIRMDRIALAVIYVILDDLCDLGQGEEPHRRFSAKGPPQKKHRVVQHSNGRPYTHLSVLQHVLFLRKSVGFSAP